MTVPTSTRRKSAPGAVMVLALLGALALLVTFIMQIAADAPPRDSEELREQILTEMEEYWSTGLPLETGRVDASTLEVIDRTSEGVVAYAFLTTNDALGIGVRTSGGGGGMSISDPGERTAWLNMTSPGTESTRSYELTVRRTGSDKGYDHTFTAK
ncbi:hypothetical protein ACFSWE_12770 [Leucobacter albus]|uniref:Uncharacterized protein n=1 Tax=Leucobacter albus TaxID=272210 RepID=A0ABW3TSP5_9MICO